MRTWLRIRKYAFLLVAEEVHSLQIPSIERLLLCSGFTDDAVVATLVPPCEVLILGCCLVFFHHSHSVHGVFLLLHFLALRV